MSYNHLEIGLFPVLKSEEVSACSYRNRNLGLLSSSILLAYNYLILSFTYFRKFLQVLL